MISGVINVYKEPGYTSHDVVAKLRGILKQKKIGHMEYQMKIYQQMLINGMRKINY